MRWPPWQEVGRALVTDVGMTSSPTHEYPFSPGLPTYALEVILMETGNGRLPFSDLICIKWNTNFLVFALPPCSSGTYAAVLGPASFCSLLPEDFPSFLGFISHQTGISLSLKAQLVTLGSQNNIQKEFITALGWHWLSWKWTVWNKPPALENNSFLFLLVGRGNKMPHIKRPLVWVSCVTRLSWKHWDSRLFGSLEHGRFHADFQENKGNHEMLEIILLWVCLNQNLIVSECVPGRCCRQCRDGRWGSQDLYSLVGIGNDTSDISLSATHYLSRNYHHLFLLKVTEHLLMAPGFEG